LNKIVGFKVLTLDKIVGFNIEAFE